MATGRGRANHRAGRPAAWRAGCAGVLAAAAAGADPVYSRITVDTAVPGAAFVVGGNLMDNPRPELVVAAFGQITFGPTGPVFPSRGTVTLYRNAEPGNAPNAQLASGTRSRSSGSTMPSRSPTGPTWPTSTRMAART